MRERHTGCAGSKREEEWSYVETQVSFEPLQLPNASQSTVKNGPIATRWWGGSRLAPSPWHQRAAGGWATLRFPKEEPGVIGTVTVIILNGEPLKCLQSLSNSFCKRWYDLLMGESHHLLLSVIPRILCGKPCQFSCCKTNIVILIYPQ